VTVEFNKLTVPPPVTDALDHHQSQLKGNTGALAINSSRDAAVCESRAKTNEAGAGSWKWN